jgi:hypothetical protein
MFERTNDFGGGSESPFVKPSESNVNLSSISLGSEGFKRNHFNGTLKGDGEWVWKYKISKL